MKRLLLLVLASSMHSIAPKKNQTNIVKKLKVGQSFSIALKANPTTGYQWRCICTPEDLVTTTNAFTRNAAQQPEMVGVGGTETFTITAAKPGTAHCTLEYGRAWDPESFENTQKYTLKIKK